MRFGMCVMLTALRSSTPSFASCSRVTNLVVNTPRLFSCRLGVAGCKDSPIAPRSFRPGSKSIKFVYFCFSQLPALDIRLSGSPTAPLLAPKRLTGHNYPKHELEVRFRLVLTTGLGSGPVQHTGSRTQVAYLLNTLIYTQSLSHTGLCCLND